MKSNEFRSSFRGNKGKDVWRREGEKTRRKGNKVREKGDEFRSTRRRENQMQRHAWEEKTRSRERE